MQFPKDKNDFITAANFANKCDDFLIDDDDECVSDEEISCFNCIYRRWLEKGITCMKKKKEYD